MDYMKNTTPATGDALKRFGAGLADSAETLTVTCVRHLVEAYFAIGQYRRTGGSRRAAVALGWLFERNKQIENEISRALDAWTDAQPAARWAKAIPGIGPVIAAGLAAHIDIEEAPTVGHIWRFAGLDPTMEWKPGTRRPWNPALNRLCRVIGNSFAHGSGRDGDFYGSLFRRRRRQDIEANNAGEFTEQARRKLDRCDAEADPEAYRWYAEGKLPPAHIRARAMRWTVKMFLAHYHHVAWTAATGLPPAKPYVVSVLGHTDYITPPNFGRTA